jgi:hypothetical protein
MWLKWPPALNQEIKHFTLVVDGAPEPETIAVDRDHHLVQMVIARFWPRPADIGSDSRTEFEKPSLYSLAGGADAPFSKQLFDTSKGECEPGVESDRLANDLGRESVTFERDRFHRFTVPDTTRPVAVDLP